MSSPPISPRILLEIASFEMNPIGEEEIGLASWDQFVAAVKESPGKTLAHGLLEHIDAPLYKKVIDVAKETFNSAIGKKSLEGEAQIFVKIIDSHVIQKELPPGSRGLEKDLFQLLGHVYDLLNDHRQSAKAYQLAAKYAEIQENKILEAELVAEAAIQILLINPRDESSPLAELKVFKKTREDLKKEALDWFEKAEDELKMSQSDKRPLISYYRRALGLLEGDYGSSAKILEAIGEIYASEPELKNQARESFVQAATYHGFINHGKDQARNLKKAAICAAKLGDPAAADLYKTAAEVYAKVEDHFSATGCFSEAISQSQCPELQSNLHERAAFHSHQLEKYVDARDFYAKVPNDHPVYNPNISFKYKVLAADQLAEKEPKESAACFKEAALYYEKTKQFLDAAQCLEKLLQVRAKYKDQPKIKDFEILGRIADAYRQAGNYLKALNVCKEGFSQDLSSIDWEKIAGESLDLLEATPLSESHEERREVVDTLIKIGEILRKKMSGELAAKTYELINKWQQEDLPDIADLFKEAGRWFDFTSKSSLFAIACYKWAAGRYLRLKQCKDAAYTFRDLGFLYQACSEPLKAAESYVVAAEQDLLENLSPLDRALDWTKAATCYHQAGFSQKAIDCYLSAATLNRDIQSYEEAGKLLQTAAELGSQHLYEQAAECFILALKIKEAVSCYKNCSPRKLPELLASHPIDRVISTLKTNEDKANSHQIIALFCSEMKLWSHAACHWHEAGSCLQEQKPGLAAEFFRNSADAYFECSDFSKAVKAYLLAAKLSNGVLQGDCFLGAARSYTKKNLRKEAVSYFSKATEIYEPIDVNLAIQSLKEAIDCKIDSEILMGLYGRILTLLDQGNEYKQQLKRCWLKWKDQPLNDLPSIVWAAKGFVKVGEHEFAAGAYYRASKLTADRKQASLYLEEASNHYKLANNAALWASVSQELASLYLKLKQDIQAAHLFAEIGEFYEEKKDSKNAAPFFLKAASIFKSAKHYQKAADHFMTSELYNQAGECYQHAGQLYLLTNQDLALASYNLAIQAFEQGNDVDGKDRCCIEAARELSKLGKGGVALDFYKQVSSKRSDPNTMISYCKQAALQLEKPDPACAALRWGAAASKLALKMNHETAETYKRAADLYLKAGVFDKAATDYLQAKDAYLKWNKNKKEAASCSRSAAECFVRFGEIAESIAAYKQAGLLYLSIDVAQAIECFESAIQQENNPRASILSYLEKIHKTSPQWKTFLTQAARWFEEKDEFAKAMGVYGMLLKQYHQDLLLEERQEVREKIERCLKRCEHLKEGLADAAIWAARAFVVQDSTQLSMKAKLYKLAWIWESDEQKAVEHLEKATHCYEMSMELSYHLEDCKKLAELYIKLGKFREAGFLFEKIGQIYKSSPKFYEEAAQSLKEAARWHKECENISQAVNSVSIAAKCWSSLGRFDQAGNCLELAGEWNSLTSPERAIADLLKASAYFQRVNLDQRAKQCLHRASTLNDQAASSKKISLNPLIYDRKAHINYLDQLASTLNTDEESLLKSLYYQQISDFYKEEGRLILSEEYQDKATLFKENWLYHRTNLLLQLLLKSQEYKDDYQQIQKWIEEMTSVEMFDEALKFLEDHSNFEPMTPEQLHHLKSNCDLEKSRRWSTDLSYQVQIERIFKIIMKKTEAPLSKSEGKLEESESSSGSSQEASESSFLALDTDY